MSIEDYNEKLPVTKDGGWAKINGKDTWTRGELCSTNTYNPKRVKHYLENIDAINQKAEEKIERIRKRRDEQTSMYEQLIIKERAKPEKT